MAYKTDVITYTNKVCPACGQAFTGAAVHCRKQESCICMNHCIECKHQKDWRCLYRADQDPDKLIKEFYRRNDVQRKNAMPKDTAPN